MTKISTTPTQGDIIFTRRSLPPSTLQPWKKTETCQVINDKNLNNPLLKGFLRAAHPTLCPPVLEGNWDLLSDKRQKLKQSVAEGIFTRRLLPPSILQPWKETEACQVINDKNSNNPLLKGFLHAARSHPLPLSLGKKLRPVKLLFLFIF
jgi:hypothetical protein